MKKIFDFGKIAYYGEREENRVTVEMELKTKENGMEVLSICGAIWNRTNTDWISGGQNLEEIASTPVGNNPKFKEIYRFWKLYHLNDMHPECIHQEELGWKEEATEKLTINHYYLTSETRRAKEETEKAIINAAKNGETYTASESEKELLNLDNWIETTEELHDGIKNFYRLGKTETQVRGWIRYDKDKNGILCKPCPICGYKYGSSWTFREIPANDLARIKELLTGDK